ncbi:hypothetical protein EHO61_16925 [Leptospira fluminis]|uniref:Porin n=1 Tax=Leptospira fluminis TaxID=2484979 RepID=A0A4R9GKI9_9LEPT|nr:hypothetical protein [Leptospira fluminis]TGK14752.1 hypothetical protein EHO61_16925 [Leptospira fluminis]
MKVRFLVFLYLICPSILVAEVVSDEARIRISTFGFKTQGKRNTLEKNQTQTERFGGIALPFWIQFRAGTEREDWKANLELDAVSTGEDKLRILPGKEAYLALYSKGLYWGFGRKSDPNSLPGWFHWNDGVEGFFVETKRSERYRIRFDALDFYRGFPLAENRWLIWQGKDSYLPASARKELGTVSQSSESLSQTKLRYRTGIGLWGKENSGVFYNLQIRYLSLGNWGRFGEETSEARAFSSLGDKDYLSHMKAGLGYFLESFYVLGEGLASRGLDKTATHPQRAQKSLPISGEALRIETGVFGIGWCVSLYGFLPNGDRRSKNGEILELGFVGMGTSPLPNPLLNQVWGWVPGAWITGAGLEKDSTWIPSKRPSGIFGTQGSFKFGNLRLEVRSSYIQFLSDRGASSGAWSISPKGFSNSFIREGGFTIGWAKREGNIPDLQLDLGGIESDRNTGIKQWYLLFKFGWEFSCVPK